MGETIVSDAANAVQPREAGSAGSTPPQRLRWSQRLFGDLNPFRLFGGILLGILVIASAACAVVFFAAAQFQARVAELSLNGAPMTIWRVDEFRGEFKDWAADIRKLREGIAQDRINLANDQQKNLVLDAEQQNAETRLGDDARSLQQRIIAASPQAAGPTPPSTSDLSGIMTQIELLLAQDELQKRFGEDFAGLKKRYAENQDLRAQVKIRVAKIKGYTVWIAALEEHRKERVEAAAKLFGESNAAAAPELVERIVNITAELNSLSSIWRGIIYRTALWTNDMLVLLLLISMACSAAP
jgi:hypothetical protein